MRLSRLIFLSTLLFSHNLIAEEQSVKANKVILKYTGEKLEPSRLELKKLDSSIFFLNESQNKEVDIEIDFKNKKMHCHSENLKLVDGSLKSDKPIKPRDFEVLCFPSAGTYAYQVKEGSSKGKILKGEIIISE